MLKRFGVVAIALLFSAQAEAQMNPQQHMMDHGSMQMEMMQGEMGANMMMQSGIASPGMILKVADQLDITADQRTRLEALQTSLAASVKPHMEAAMMGHQQAAAALKSDRPDIKAYESALETAMTHMTQAHVATAAAGLEARAVLTAEQRTRLASAAHMMGGMMGDMMDGKMSDMMGHGMRGGGAGMVHNPTSR